MPLPRPWQRSNEQDREESQPKSELTRMEAIADLVGSGDDDDLGRHGGLAAGLTGGGLSSSRELASASSHRRTRNTSLQKRSRYSRVGKENVSRG